LYTIYHNPRCSKSRTTLDLLREKVLESDIKVIEYLKNIPSESEIRDILIKLTISAKELIRVKEADFTEFKHQSLSEDDYVKLMVERPKLIERPIVIHGDKAIIGRPPENVLTLI
jgi:arsenate reductase